MTERVQNLEKAVAELTPSEYQQFAGWFLDFDQTVWENKIESDARAGRLDFLMDEARSEKSAQKLKNL